MRSPFSQEYHQELRRYIIHGAKPNNTRIIFDAEVAQLCLMLGKLPSEILGESEEWLWKIQLVAATNAEKDSRDGRSRDQGRRTPSPSG